MTSLAGFAERLLARRGALVESAGENELEVVLGPELARTMARPEWLSLSTAPQPPVLSFGREWLGFGADLFQRFEALLESRTAGIRLPTETFRMEKLGAGIRDRICFNNAAFDIEPAELRTASWLVVWSRYAAISDDRREGLVSFWINEANLSAGTLPEEREEWLRAMGVWADGLGASVAESADEPDPQDVGSVAGARDGAGQARQGAIGLLPARPEAEVLAAAARSAAALARESLGDYLDLSRRRLERDVRRVCEYYGALKAEADRRGARLASSGRRTADEEEKLARKIAAIELERKAKIDDLRAHYALRIETEPVSIVRLTALAPVFPLRLRRRKETRPFPLVYNPFIHRLESLPCESCGSGMAPYWMCDERLHILCDRCFPPCRVCGRRYCRACSRTCPKGCAGQ